MKKPVAFGKYFLLERISLGGMAEVFRAKAFGVEGFERLVVVKRILPDVAADKEFIRLFIEEAKLSVQLNHANIGQIFDLGVVDGSYYIALEHVHGRDLRGIFDRCRQLGEAMPVAQACFIAMKVCEGLDYAHNKRDQAGRELALVHRDVSPQNILVSFEGEVKLIDFGVAKAAEAGPATLAGVIGGRLRYMSPEQARGAAVDRRSDVFSCGIVLYELLTGERLFVGDSDYATLEKVRNVEILPPSTYNRKIPDELERIVLKALARDVADRYQNAIDLHDELQAFVYTAGAFYSRKDLAGWMKQTFDKEIEQETAKLESYRQLKPPTAGEPAEVTAAAVSGAVRAAPPSKAPPRPVAARAQPTAAAGRSRSASIPLPAATMVTPPITIISPPPPEALALAREPGVDPAEGGLAPAPDRLAPLVDLEAGGDRQTVSHADEPTEEISESAIEVANRASVMGHLDPSAIGWEDDEVETQIYAEQDGAPKNKPPKRPSLAPAGSSAGISLPSAGPANGVEVAAELMEVPSLTAQSAPRRSLPPATPAEPAVVRASIASERSARNPRSATAGKLSPGTDPDSTQPVQSTSGEFLAATTEVSQGPPPRFDLHTDNDAAPVAALREISARSRLVSAADPVRAKRFDPMASFGSRITGPRRDAVRRRTLIIVVAGAALASLVVTALMVVSGGDSPRAPAASPVVARPAVAADPNTGFDLYVTPSGIMQWKLDGESRTDRLPSRIRGIAPGTHTVQIDPPPGFLSESRPVTVEHGKSSKVEIKLQPLTGIVGSFESSPPAATVSLIIDGKRQVIGPSPAKASLDPRNMYQVLFEKPGYVSVNRPVRFSGGLEERIVVALEKAEGEAPASAAPRSAPALPRTRSTPEKPPGGAGSPGVGPSGDRAAVAGTQGVLSLGAKPPCEILVDGAPTGLRTPQTEIKLSVGRHRITLVNSEFSIRESFLVDIKPDAPEKLIKDYSDRLPR